MASRRSRKSKARRSQGRKAQNRGKIKWLIYGGVTFVLLLIIGLIVGYNAVRSYLRSDDFRVMLGNTAGEMLEGDAKFEAFQWDGWSVSTDEFSFEGTEGIERLNARGIDAEIDIGAVWSRIYRIENVRLREVEILGDFRRKLGEKDTTAALLPPDTAPSPSASESFWAGFLPNSVEVTGIDVASVKGQVVTDDGIWAWENTSARVRPGSGKEVYDVELNGGEITTPIALVDQLSLKNLKGRYSGNNFYILDSEFSALEKARITAVGDYGLQSKNWQLQGDVSGARMEEIIAEDWKQRLRGPLAVKFEVNGSADSDAVVRGDLKILDGILTALPLLDRIAAYSNTARFRRLDLSEASLEFEKVGTSLDLKKIVLASEGLVRMEGDMRLDGDIIRKGDFRVGITPGTLAHLPGAETKVFQRGELGLLWTPLKITGTLDAPQEDLSDRLIAAAAERMFELIPESGQYVLKYSGEVIGDSTKAILENQGIVLGAGNALLNPVNRIIGQATGVDPAKVLGNGSDVLENGTDAVEKGVDTLFDLFGRPIPK